MVLPISTSTTLLRNLTSETQCSPHPDRAPSEPGTSMAVPLPISVHSGGAAATRGKAHAPAGSTSIDNAGWPPDAQSQTPTPSRPATAPIRPLNSVFGESVTVAPTAADTIEDA